MIERLQRRDRGPVVLELAVVVIFNNKGLVRSGPVQDVHPLVDRKYRARRELVRRRDVQKLELMTTKRRGIETVRFHRDRMEREAAAPEDVPDSVIARILHAHRVLSGIEQLEQHFKIELHAAADDDLFGRADDAPGQI